MLVTAEGKPVEQARVVFASGADSSVCMSAGCFAVLGSSESESASGVTRLRFVGRGGEAQELVADVEVPNRPGVHDVGIVTLVPAPIPVAGMLRVQGEVEPRKNVYVIVETCADDEWLPRQRGIIDLDPEGRFTISWSVPDARRLRLQLTGGLYLCGGPREFSAGQMNLSLEAAATVANVQFSTRFDAVLDQEIVEDSLAVDLVAESSILEPCPRWHCYPTAVDGEIVKWQTNPLPAGHYRIEARFSGFAAGHAFVVGHLPVMQSDDGNTSVFDLRSKTAVFRLVAQTEAGKEYRVPWTAVDGDDRYLQSGVHWLMPPGVHEVCVYLEGCESKLVQVAGGTAAVELRPWQKIMAALDGEPSLPAGFHVEIEIDATERLRSRWPKFAEKLRPEGSRGLIDTTSRAFAIGSGSVPARLWVVRSADGVRALLPGTNPERVTAADEDIRFVVSPDSVQRALAQIPGARGG